MIPSSDSEEQPGDSGGQRTSCTGGDLVTYVTIGTSVTAETYATITSTISLIQVNTTVPVRSSSVLHPELGLVPLYRHPRTGPLKS